MADIFYVQNDVAVVTLSDYDTLMASAVKFALDATRGIKLYENDARAFLASPAVVAYKERQKGKYGNLSK